MGSFRETLQLTSRGNSTENLSVNQMEVFGESIFLDGQVSLEDFYALYSDTVFRSR